MRISLTSTRKPPQTLGARGTSDFKTDRSLDSANHITCANILMAFATRLLRGTLYLATPTVAGIYLLRIRQEISPVPRSAVKQQRGVPPSFQCDRSLLQTINPKGFELSGDSREVAIDIPDHVTDEMVLASFARGFFGSYSFAPEGLALNALASSSWSFGMAVDVTLPASANAESQHQPIVPHRRTYQKLPI
jgi:hypothetical protein